MLRRLTTGRSHDSESTLHYKFQDGHRVNVRRYSESTGRPEDLTGVMASARDITGYAPPPYDHKINVWGGAGGGQTWQRINTYITAIKLLLRPIKLQFQ